MHSLKVDEEDVLDQIREERSIWDTYVMQERMEID
jgi:hypothetical protein